MRDSRQDGFTLIELMIVVAIVGVLTTLAVSMYTKSTGQTRCGSEVAAVFGEFKLRQEQYHAENGVYLSSGASESDAHPATPAVPSDGATDLTPVPLAWEDLRIQLDKTAVYCSYVSIAGVGGDDSNLGAKAGDFGMTAAPASNWYYVLAECDCDGDAGSNGNSYFFTRSDADGIAVQDRGK